MIDHTLILTLIFLNNLLFLQMMHKQVSSSERVLMSDHQIPVMGIGNLGPSIEHASGSIYMYSTTSLLIIYMQWLQKQIERGGLDLSDILTRNPESDI